MNLLEKTAEILRENGKSLNVIRLFGANLRAEPINAGFLEANQLSQISKKSNESFHFFQDDKEYMNYGILTENYGLVLGMGIDISIFSQAEANELIQEMESNCGSDFHCNIKNIVNDFLNSPNIKIFGKEQSYDKGNAGYI